MLEIRGCDGLETTILLRVWWACGCLREGKLVLQETHTKDTAGKDREIQREEPNALRKV